MCLCHRIRNGMRSVEWMRSVVYSNIFNFTYICNIYIFEAYIEKQWYLLSRTFAYYLVLNVFRQIQPIENQVRK